MTGRNLQSYYKLVFDMSYYHKYSVAELENMPVFELELFRDMIAEDIARQKAKAEGFAIG